MTMYVTGLRVIGPKNKSAAFEKRKADVLVSGLRTEFEYISFMLVDPGQPRKTDVWRCNDRHDSTLGSVSWWGAWRQYVFHPTPFSQSLFSAGCLKDIITFIESLMAERKMVKP